MSDGFGPKLGDVVNGWKLEKEQLGIFKGPLERYWGLDGALLIVSQKCSWWNGPPCAQMAADNTIVPGVPGHQHYFCGPDLKCECGVGLADNVPVGVTFSTYEDPNATYYPVPAPRSESPCGMCRTMLFDDEPSCWRCGWRR